MLYAFMKPEVDAGTGYNNDTVSKWMADRLSYFKFSHFIAKFHNTPTLYLKESAERPNGHCNVHEQLFGPGQFAYLSTPINCRL
jgi:hypothetical protein